MAHDNIQAIYPLTALQEGLLLHTLDGKRPGAYFEQYCCDLHGELALDQLQWAWQSVCDRHDVLRTLFTWDGRDRPLQIVRETVPLPWHAHDWSRLPAQQQASRWQDMLRADRAQGFKLDVAPMLRLNVISMGRSHTRMLVSFHHALMDGWSLQIVLEEVARLYRARCRGTASGLPEARQFADFVAWTAAQDKTQGIAFWRSALSGYVPLPAPDLGRREGPRPTEQDNTLRLDLEPAFASRLEALARRERVTLACCVAAAWALVLARYSGASDLAFGFTSAGRPVELQGGERMVGLFMNTPPLRLQVEATQSPGEWLRAVQQAQVRIRAFEHTPLVDIRRACGGLAGKALFETVLVFENVPLADSDAGFAGLLTLRDEAYYAYSNYPLAMVVIPGPQLSLRLVFDPGRYDAPDMQRVLRHMACALQALGEGLAQRVGDIDILPPDERDIVMAAESDATAGPAVTEVLRAHASAHAQDAALVDGYQVLSHVEFGQRTDALATHLHARGIGVGHCVPICAGRSALAVVAMVGVLKSGAAHVVLDAGLPLPRIRQMLADLAAGAGSGHGRVADCILVDADGARLLDASTDGLVAIDAASRAAGAVALPSPTGADDLAYVIYTSGSTGAPKGVALTHRNLSASLSARVGFYPLAPQRYLLISPIGTDSAIAGVYWPLYCGATLVMAPERVEQDPVALANLIAAQRISHLLCLPSLWEALLENLPAAGLSSLRCVVVAGEACSPATVAAHERCLPSVALYNEYGPAEAAVWATATRLDAADVAGRGWVPIGRAISTARVHVLDAQGRPCPLGIAGELCIGGAGVARGYWNPDTPDRTRFTTLAGQPGLRVYRTGDRARQHADGSFEFLGRIDNQVKVRGYRVEPEEIERLLASHPDIREAIVVAAHPGVGDGVPALHAALSALPHEAAEQLLSQVESMSNPPSGQATAARSVS